MKSIPFLAKATFLIVTVVSASQASAMSADELAATRYSAERGNAAAELLLGVAYLDGEAGLAADAKEGAHWLEQAALQGNAYAAERLGNLYANGTGVEKNARLSADWFERAARRDDTEAQLELGCDHLADSAARRLWRFLGHAGYTQDRVLSEQALHQLADDGDAEAQKLLERKNQNRHPIADNNQ